MVLVRSPTPVTREAAERLVAVLASSHDWARHISVIEPGRIRRRPLDDT